MNTPATFVPDQQAQAPSSFVADTQPAGPKSFIPDSSAVLNKNTTGFSMQLDNRPRPATYGDAMAMRSPLDVQSPGQGETFQDVANAPFVLLGKAVASIANGVASKDLPDERNQYSTYLNAHGQPAPHLRNFLQKALFGPSNLSVLGKDPNQEMFHQGQSILPMEKSVVGGGSDARRMLESMTTPEGISSALIAPTRLGPLVSAMYGASTVANLPDMKTADIAANALMMGIPMAKQIHEGFSPSVVPNRPDMSHMQGPISYSAPLAKEVPLPTKPNDIAFPEGTVGSTIPAGGDISGAATVSKQTAEPSSRGTLSPVDLGTAPVEFKGVQKGFKEIPDFNLYNLTQDIPGFAKGSTLGGPELQKLGYSLPEQVSNQGMNPESGSVGLHVLDPETWKELGFKAKTEGQQFINRLRNKLGGESAGWKMIDTPELKSFMQEPRTTQEVQDFVNKNGPKVEVRKFSPSGELTPNLSKALQQQHELETKGYRFTPEGNYTPGGFRLGSHFTDGFDSRRVPTEDLETLNNVYSELGKEQTNASQQSHWQSIAPKSEQDMPGYTEIAVVKNAGKVAKQFEGEKGGNKVLFPSSHSFPPNTLGFVRGYMETTPQGKKVFHVIEVQSDWAQQVREENGDLRSQVPHYQLTSQDPLLSHYERLALKAAIDHAREQGADGIAISDAETAMMTEGHDRNADYVPQAQGGIGQHVEPSQSAGMRLHYDRTLPKIAEELTGEKGTKESFGEHRMAFDISQERPNTRAITGEFNRQRKDLIFRNESSQPKTDITARVYPITKAAKDFSIIGKDKPRQVGNQGVSGESGMIDPEILKRVTASARELIKRVRDYGYEVKVDEDGYPHLLKGDKKVIYNQVPVEIQKIQNQLSDYGFGLIMQGQDPKEVFGLTSKVDANGRLLGNQGVTGESGMVNLSGARESLDKGIENLKEFFSDEGIRRKTMKMAGVSVPRTTAANEKVGNQLTMFAQAEGVAEAKARAMASEVLGSHWKDKEFDAKLGAVGVEDQLRTLKAQLLSQGKTSEAQSVNTLVGQPYSPIKSEAQYQQLKNAPEIKAALARHIATVQGLAEQKQTALKGAIRAVGQDTGSFFNLIAKGVDSGEINKARQGNTLATLKGGTRFGKEFKGTGAEYEISYRKMAERMVKGNWTEVEKQKLFDLVDSSGFGHLQKAGEDLPTFDKPMSPIPVQRRMAVIVKPGEKPVMKSQNETLWVPKHTEGEFKQAFQTDSPLKHELLQGAGKIITGIQTSLGADAAIHVGNLAGAVATSPEKATAIKYMTENLAKVMEDSPEVQKRLAKMAEESGIVGQGEGDIQAAWKKLIPSREMIKWVDQAGRLTFDQLYTDAVRRGESPDSPVWRRAAVQGALGEYNKRLMTKLQQGMKELGVSPFLVAGKTLNKLSLKQLVLSPGRKSLNIQGGAKMRLRQALYATGLLVAAPMIINSIQTGNPFPKGVQPGQFVIKKNEDGSYVVGDIAKLLMWRRGLRNSGIQAVAKGIEDKQSVGQIAMQAGKDIGRGIAHPLAGPVVSTADTVLGSGIMSDRPAKPFSGRGVDAIKQLNPTAAMLFDSNPNKTGSEKAIGGIGRVVGLNITQNHVSRVKTLAHQWMDRNGVLMVDEPAGPYNELTNALRKNDAQTAREAIKKLTGKDRSDDVIKGYYDKIATSDFTDSKKHEKLFLSELSDEDKKVYQSVKDSNAQVRERFYNIFMGRPAPRLPREGREERPTRENKFLPR